MNLTTLFNFKFLKENIKRSKAIILLCMFLIPVINVIVYLMSAVNSNNFVPSIFEISVLSLVGMYVVPVILSITLFSFVYKRKSSDFVMSFPVTKKQVFISNTVGGIAVLVLMNLVNLVLILISSLLLKNVLIDYKMILDMFILWTISYIFVFVCSNIAVSVSSNKITTIVVTLLVLFLIPFAHTFITSDGFKGNDSSISSTYCANNDCKPVNYECHSTSCMINEKNDIYMYTDYVEVMDTNYTMPYMVIISAFFGINSTYDIGNSLIKMFFLSILYIVIGILLFNRKKFEVVETSFKNERVHIFVRSLTLVPILCVYYIILINNSIGLADLFTLVFLFALVVTYIIIYDLLTRKRVTNIFKSLASLVIVGIIVIFTGQITKSDEEVLDVKDINTMTFLNTDLSTSEGYTYDRKIINYIMSIHIENVRAENGYYEFFNIMISTDNGSYRFQISVTEQQYNYIMNSLNNDKTYVSTAKKFKDNNVFAISLGHDVCFISKDNKLYDKIIEEYRKNAKINKEDENKYLFDASLYVYDDFNVDEVVFNITNESLMEEILNYYNICTKKAFSNPDINIDSYIVGNIYREDYFYSYKYDYSKLNEFILNNLSNSVDINKSFKYVKFYVYDDHRNSYIFVTNKVSEIDNILEEIKSIDYEDKVKGDV